MLKRVAIAVMLLMTLPQAARAELPEYTLKLTASQINLLAQAMQVSMAAVMTEIQSQVAAQNATAAKKPAEPAKPPPPPNAPK